MSEKPLKIFCFVDSGRWLAIYEGDMVIFWAFQPKSDLDEILKMAKSPTIEPYSPVTTFGQKLLSECKRGEHDDCCVWSSERETSMSENPLRIFHFRSNIQYRWLALYENGKVMWWEPKEANQHTIVEQAYRPSKSPFVPEDPDLIRLVENCWRGIYSDCCVWSRGAKPPGLKSGAALALEAEKSAPIKEFPFAKHRFADSFEEFDYSVNAPSEGGLSIDVMDRDDDAAERILRARIARQQKWPFCPTHQRNVDLEFNHDGVGHDRTIHEAYWICFDCWQERRGR